ncbi:Zn-dependent hydrolase [Niallia sp. 03133]|uniref:Zn-dependent hydrolase n=1 Tax=Niallia sp. 03133 TaxID=3458060 RepID=UPI004045038A
MQNVFSKNRLLKNISKCSQFAGIHPEELAEKLAALAEIGKTDKGGVTRFPFTVEEKKAKHLFIEWMKEIGLQVREDTVGNIFGRLKGSEPNLPVVLTGSHLDSVPNGGVFDGPLGCLSSLFAIKSILDSGQKIKRSIELVVFVDEEGSRFKNGIFGSRVMMGEVEGRELTNFKDENGEILYDVMKNSGYNPERLAEAHRPKNDIYAFLELHIEQGKKLESEQKNIGIVSGIAGPAVISLTFFGQTDHAGNTPMEFRKDTVTAAAAFILEVEKAPRKFSQTAVATVGKMNIYPNGTNVVAGKTEIVLDARDVNEQAREEMIVYLKDTAKEIAESRGLSVEIQEGLKIPPVIISDKIKTIISTAAEISGLTTMTLPSGAAHDAMTLGKYVPSGMIFVPSLNGKSHSPEEWTSLPDCVNGVQVLKESIVALANE